MILWRLLPLAPDVAPSSPGGALWFPRELQGSGRHDNPDRYGCLYLSGSPISAVAEALAQFRGAGVLSRGMLVRAGLALALVRVDCEEDRKLVDLDDPNVLTRTRLRPSRVATKARAVTQAYAARIFDAHPTAVGLRWWSTLEASLTNFTLYDRAAPALRLAGVEPLTLEHPATREAAELLGLAIARRR
ncbi:MAG: RES family NAD+ phosphorylase [Solirubrobacteraceae bacterium]